MSTESFRAVGTKEHLSADGWNNVLKEIEDIREPGTRGLIMSQVSAGIDAVLQRYAPPKTPRPPLTVPIKPLEGHFGPNEGKIFYSDANRMIIASRTWLENMSRAPIDKEVSIVGQNGEAPLIGRITDLCFLNGCEEEDHALWDMENLPVIEATSEQRANMAAYDAMPNEYRALQRQFEIAMSLSMPQVTINVLSQRLENALRIIQAMR